MLLSDTTLANVRLRAVSRSELPQLGVLTLASLALRLAILDRALGYDESFSYREYAWRAPWTAIGIYNFPNNHLFHTFCMSICTHLFGLSVVSLRLPALLFGVALVPLTYLLARTVAGATSGLIAAALVGGCDVLATYSADGRGYAVQSSLFVAALLILPSFMGRPSLGIATGFAFLLALALFTIPTLVYGVLTPFLWGAMLARTETTGYLRRLSWLLGAGVVAALLTVALYFPALSYVREHGFNWGEPLKPQPLLVVYGSLLQYLIGALPPALGLALLVLAAAGALFDAWLARRIPLLLPWIGAPLGALAVHMTLTPRPPFARNFVFMLPLLFVLSGRAIEAAAALAKPHVRSITERAGPALAAALFLFSAGGAYGRYQNARQRMGVNTHFLFEAVVRPLRPGDDFAAPKELVVPIQIYAEIAGVALTRMRGSWEMATIQASAAPGVKRKPALKSKEQRFFLLAMQPVDRKRAPEMLRSKVEGGRYVWVERRRLRTYQKQDASLWELTLDARPHRSRERHPQRDSNAIGLVPD